MIFALVGNQNCGKTTLFNQLTGSNQHVGNFPGVTVESKTGQMRSQKDCQVVDLPGIYSIRPYTNEEIVTKDFILNEKPDGIINIVDATNIERNLYLTLQLISLKVPMVLALNMMDEVRNNGGTIDIEKLSQKLGIPVIPISAAKNEGIQELIDTAVNVAKNKTYPTVYDFCEQGPVHRCIHAVCHLIEDHAQNAGYSTRFCATKIIEGDRAVENSLGLDENEKEMIEHSVIQMETESGLDRNAAIADMRYSFIEKTCKDTVVKCQESKEHKRSVKIDKVLTNKYAAIPVFLSIMLLIFYLTFGLVGQGLATLLEKGIDKLCNVVIDALARYGLNEVVINLIQDGIFEGVGSVLSFLPYILVLFLLLSILEDSGYMARVAFIMDKPLRKIGLSGRSFVPMLLGFGCSVPAVMSTRTLSSERDRKMTIMLIPFISCSAKIVIYSTIAHSCTFSHPVLLIFGLYLIGIVLGIVTALILDKTLYKGKPVPFVMELPNYRFPSFKSVALLMWEKAKDFIQRAFTVIFIATLIIWFFKSFDMRLNFVGEQTGKSMLFHIGKFVLPAFAPIGIKDGAVVASLIAGFSAKEAVVGTLNILTTDIAGMFVSTAGAFGFLIFTLLYTPCIAAVSAISNELKSKKKAILVVVFQCVVAYVVAILAYNVARLFI